MNNTFLSLGLFSATLFLAAARSDEPKTVASTVLDPAEAGLLRRYDLNHDGKLGDQGMTLQLLGLWRMLTPRIMFGKALPDEQAMQMAGSGYVSILSYENPLHR